MSRREFVKLALTTGVAVAAGACAPAASTSTSTSGGMIYRTLGRTNEKISAIGLGGYHIGLGAEDDALRLMRRAIDGGITFMDNCWDYNAGVSEERMGKALRDGYRQKVFLMTKIDGQTKAAASRQMDDCLKRLQTDHIDLMQCHEVIREGDPARIFGEGGSIEALTEAKKAGKIRYIGFTGHKDPAMHLRMLETARKHDFHFDAVQMPLNVLDAHFRSFAKQVVPELVKDGIGVLGMKALAFGRLMQLREVTAIECLHYALNLPTSTVITGIDSEAILDQAFEAARTFKPMDEATLAALLKRTATAAADGDYERFKTTTQFDGTASHPEWLG